MEPLYIVGIVFAVWVLMNLKSSRPDGTLLKTHPYRRMLSFLMPTRNESVVLFDGWVKADPLLEYIEKAREHFHVDVTHCLVAAGAIGLAKAPKMNRFTNGRRLYQRKGHWITFSMKRKKLNKEAKIAAVKMEIKPEDTLRTLVERINEKIGVERSEKVTYTDKELNLFLHLPRAVLNWAIKLCFWLNYHNMLPGSFIKGDPMFTSIFIANLGSLGMDAGFHHLFEWGTCPLFLMVGAVEERPVVEDGKVVARRMMHIRYNFDERIDDGLNANVGILSFKKALENPSEIFGCLDPDGSDAHPLGESAS